jgi:hypothetical protein
MDTGFFIISNLTQKVVWTKSEIKLPNFVSLLLYVILNVKVNILLSVVNAFNV